MSKIQSLFLPSRMLPADATMIAAPLVAYHQQLGDDDHEQVSLVLGLLLSHQSWHAGEPQSLAYHRTALERNLLMWQRRGVALLVGDDFAPGELGDDAASLEHFSATLGQMCALTRQVVPALFARNCSAALLCLQRAGGRDLSTSPGLLEALLQSIADVDQEVAWVNAERAHAQMAAAAHTEVARLRREARSWPAKAPAEGGTDDLVDELRARLRGQPSGRGGNGAQVPAMLALAPSPRAAAAATGGIAVSLGELLRVLESGGRPGSRNARPEAVAKTSASEPVVQGAQAQVFDAEAVALKLSKMPAPSGSEGNSQQHKLMTQMANSSGMRALTEAPEADPLLELYETYPHFGDVLDFVSSSLALAACGEEGRPVRIPAVLLRGEPGTGKTSFAQELARVLGAEFIERDLSVTTEAFVLAGMDSGWKGSKPGVVFDSLVNGKTANPFILLNEVDKAGGRGSHNSPIAAMYALLEPTSSGRFIDEFVPVEIDASRVNWILTANNGEIPEPVLSRLEVFDIRQPTPQECRQIAASVWKSICTRVLPRGHGFAPTLDEAVLQEVAHLNPRIMRKALTLAAALAAKAGRKAVGSPELQASQKRYVAPAATSRPIGFMN